MIDPDGTAITGNGFQQTVWAVRPEHRYLSNLDIYVQ